MHATQGTPLHTPHLVDKYNMTTLYKRICIPATNATLAYPNAQLTLENWAFTGRQSRARKPRVEPYLLDEQTIPDYQSLALVDEEVAVDKHAASLSKDESRTMAF